MSHSASTAPAPSPANSIALGQRLVGEVCAFFYLTFILGLEWWMCIGVGLAHFVRIIKINRCYWRDDTPYAQ